MDSWICGWGSRRQLFVRGGLGGARRMSAAGRETGLGGGERTGCVAGAAVVALIAGEGRGPEPGSRGAGERRQTLPCRERGAESGQRPQERRRSVEAAAASCSDDGRGRSPSRAVHETHYQSNPPRQADSNNPENSFQCRSGYIFCRSQMGIGPPQFPCIIRQIVYPGVYTFETLLRHSFSHSPVRQSACSHFFGSPNEVQPRRQLRGVCRFCVSQRQDEGQTAEGQESGAKGGGRG